MKASEFVNRLDKVRQVKANQYEACCPAHHDNNPSLKVSETEDGRILIKCWAGCSALDVITAVGCEWQDLFPDGDKNYRSVASFMGIRPAGTINDRIVDIAIHTPTTGLTDSQREEWKKAELKGGEPDGFCAEVAKNLPENKQWSEQWLEFERELLKAEFRLK